MGQSVATLVLRGDLDGLTAEVDRLANREDWPGLLALRDRCLRAVEESGRQLFGPAQFAAYRVALDAPAELAVAVLEPGVAPFALGPLTEVVAQHHGWDELADHLDRLGIAPVSGAVAQERVLRGDVVTGDGRARLGDSGLPGQLLAWEPAYALPTYRADEVSEHGPPPIRGWTDHEDDAPGRALSEDRHASRLETGQDVPGIRASLREVVSTWEDHSNGEVHIATVSGGPENAVAAVLPGPFQMSEIGAREAFHHLVWAGASGGARGRRRGFAAARGLGFWLTQTIVVVDEDVPDDERWDEVEFGLEDLEWHAFRPLDDDGVGWRLQLAFGPPDGGWAVAVDARDRDPDTPEAR